MRIGAVFPQTEIGDDPVAIRDWAQAEEGLGYRHILAYEHVLGFAAAPLPSYVGPVTPALPFHEPFVLFSSLAGPTRRVELAMGVLVVPMRQTVLVAKRAVSWPLAAWKMKIPVRSPAPTRVGSAGLWKGAVWALMVESLSRWAFGPSSDGPGGKLAGTPAGLFLCSLL